MLDDLIGIVEEAGALALELGPVGPRSKTDGSVVTEADLAVSGRLAARLASLLPGAAMLDEEQGTARLPGPGAVWVVDPIDGTTNFLRGDDRWCISVALCVDGRPQVGVVHQPSLGRTWAADPESASAPPIGPGTVGTMVGGRLPWSPLRWGRMARAMTIRGGSIRLSGSVALDLVDVASGRACQAALFGVRFWDVAAGMVLLQHRRCTTRIWSRDGCMDLLATSASAGMSG